MCVEDLEWRTEGLTTLASGSNDAALRGWSHITKLVIGDRREREENNKGGIVRNTNPGATFKALRRLQCILLCSLLPKLVSY